MMSWMFQDSYFPAILKDSRRRDNNAIFISIFRVDYILEKNILFYVVQHFDCYFVQLDDFY